MYRTLLAILSAFGLALLAVGLTFSASTEAPAEFRFGNNSEPRTLDPHLMTDVASGRIAQGLFEGLTRLEARSLQPVPGVAETWEISADARTYVFHLREDARWSDGRPVTAHDFVYSWKRLLDPELGAQYAYLLHMLRDAEAYNTYAGHAERLQGAIRSALAALRRQHPQGVAVPDWQRFLAEQRVTDAVQGTPDPLLRDAMLERERALPPDRLESVANALAGEARRRRELARQASERFGVDRGVFARDARTLVVELVSPTPYFLEIAAFYSTFPVPRWVVEQPENRHDWFLPAKLVSNGPYRLAAWRVNDRIRLVRSDTYWDRARVASASIDALPVENATTALNLYLTGELDWLPSNYPSDLAQQLRSRPDFYSHPGLAIYMYPFNCRRPPLDDARVRQAISLAIDRRVIVEEVLGVGQVPAHHVVPPGLPGYEPPESALGYDVERARALLAEAGYPGGRGIRELGIIYNTDEAHKKIAEVVADQLRRNLGIRISAYNQEFQSFLATVRSGDYDMARYGWYGDYLDPNTFLDMWVTNGGNNHAGWSSPQFDRLIRAAANVESLLEGSDDLPLQLREPERTQQLVRAARSAAPGERAAAGARLRMQLLREAEAILVQEAFPVMPIYFYVMSGLVAPDVKGFYPELEFDDGTRGPNLLDRHPLNQIRIERAASEPGGRS